MGPDTEQPGYKKDAVAPSVLTDWLCGISRAEWHDKAWALFHEKTFHDIALHKANIHTIRAVFDATFDALIKPPNTDIQSRLYEIVRKERDRYASLIADGQGEWPKQGYVKSETWAAWNHTFMVLDSILHTIK